jgi:AI-2 transport protein TqsA
MLKFMPNMQNEKTHPALNLLLVGLILFGLIVGKHLLIPLVMAIVVWYLINSIGSQIGRIKIGEWESPKWLRTTLAVGVVFSFFRFIGRLVVSNLEEFAEVADEYNAKFQELVTALSERFGTETIQQITSSVDVAKYAEDMLNSSITFISALFVVIFYVVFLMIEQNIFGKKLDLIFTQRKNKVQFFQTIDRIDNSMKKYMSVKSLLSLMVAVSAYIVFISFGVDFAVLWAFLAFLLNFIPFVGSFVAIVLPSLLSLLQFGDPLIALFVFVILNVVQLIVGNILEPKMVGKSLNLSPLVIVLALAFWGAIWGVAGMFLCVPMTVALMIILSQFPGTRTAAILLSAGNDPSGKQRNAKSGESE